MYTFKRPAQSHVQHDPQQNDTLPPEMDATMAAPPKYPTHGAHIAEGIAHDAYTHQPPHTGEELQPYQGTPQEEQQQQQQQQTDGTLAEDAPEEEVLQYCRKMILRNNTTPPPHWCCVRTELPTSVAELHLTPSSPEEIQQAHPITPSPCVVLQLDGAVPEGMTPKEYAKGLVKYVFDLLVYQRASTAITSLRFVKIGTELSQLVVVFGRDVRLATRILEEVARVGFVAGFGPLPAQEPPNATFQITDYHLSMHDGKGINVEDLTALLEPIRPPLGIRIIEGYEPGVFYAAVKRSETVYAWLWNPFNSFLVQRMLFERFGVFITMASCPHEFLKRGNAHRGGPQHGRNPMTRRRGEDWNHNEDTHNEEADGVQRMDENDHALGATGARGLGDEMDEEDHHSLTGRRGGYATSGKNAWNCDAKEEIDIFAGLDTASKVKDTESGKQQELQFAEDEITELLQGAKTEKKTEKQPQQQQQQQPQHSYIPTYNTPASGPTSLLHPKEVSYLQPPIMPYQSQPPPQDFSPQEASYGYNTYGAYPPPPPPPPQGLWQREQHLLQQPLPHNQTEECHFLNNVSVQTPPQQQQQPLLPLFNMGEMSVYGTPHPPSNTAPSVKYPELVDDDDPNFNPAAPSVEMLHGNVLGNVNSMPPLAPPISISTPNQPLYWQTGGTGCPTMTPYAMPSPQSNPSVMPSILGQHAYGNPYNSNNNNNNNIMGVSGVIGPSSEGILTSHSIFASQPPHWTRVPSSEEAAELAIRLEELVQMAFPSTPFGDEVRDGDENENREATGSSEAEKGNDKEHEKDEKQSENQEVAHTSSDSNEKGTGTREENVSDLDPHRVSEKNLLFHHILPGTCVPPPTAEVSDLDAFFAAQSAPIRSILESQDTALQESRRRIATTLLAPHADTETEDWQVMRDDDNNNDNNNNINDDNDDEEENEKKENANGNHDMDNNNKNNTCNDDVNTKTERVGHLPSLVPYMLRSAAGVEIAAALAAHHTKDFLPLLTRHSLPFLLDPNVVQTVLSAALRAEPGGCNPLVLRILCFWSALTSWLHAHIQSCARDTTEMETEQQRTTARSAVVRRLTSQVGNTMDILLAAMSQQQRETARRYLDSVNAVEEFVKTSPTTTMDPLTRERHEEGEEMEGNRTENEGNETREDLDITGAIVNTPVPSLWSPEGAVHRSLLRLYLNADLISGAEVLKCVFDPLPILTREQFYYVHVAFSKSLVSPVLSKETACLCGGFLRLMEERLLRQSNEEERKEDVDEKKDNSTTHVSPNPTNQQPQNQKPQHPPLTEKDALHLLDAALRTLDSNDTYKYLRGAYLQDGGDVTTETRHYEKVAAKLSKPTPPVNGPHGSHQGAVLGTPSSSNPTHSQSQTHPPGSENSLWRSEWTDALRHYPSVGEPFTPLPTGWTSALSRSYGHYYYKDAKGVATYKHPTDATDYMATPQAFMQEVGCMVSLDDVLSRANSGIVTEPITKAQAESWLQDQRVRVVALDMAALDLLKVTYRSGGRRNSTGLDNTRGDHPSHHNSSNVNSNHTPNQGHTSDHVSGGRGRAGSVGMADLNRRLTKLSTYPPRGHPFPPLPRGWSCNLSASNGLYYFRPPRGVPVYRHPDTRKEYRASPQAFVLHRGVHVNAIVAETHRSVREVEDWLADQTRREEWIDAAVVRLIPIHYTQSADYEEEEELEMRGGGEEMEKERLKRSRDSTREITPRKVRSRRR